MRSSLLLISLVAYVIQVHLDEADIVDFLRVYVFFKGMEAFYFIDLAQVHLIPKPQNTIDLNKIYRMMGYPSYEKKQDHLSVVEAALLFFKLFKYYKLRLLLYFILGDQLN